MPLRLRPYRAWFYGTGLAASEGFIVAYNTLVRPWVGDWAIFWFAGATVGTRALLDATARHHWQVAHHIVVEPFVYPPGVAWVFVPAAHLSTALGFRLNVVLMAALCILSAFLVAHIYRFTLAFAILAICAWSPDLSAAAFGQFTPLALVLSLCAILGIVRSNWLLAGFAIGALLYKPPDAIAFILLVTVRREWRALAMVGVISIGWYLASVMAAAGDWLWPAVYVHMIATYGGADFSQNVHSGISVPWLFMYLGAGRSIGIAASIAVLSVSAPVLARVSRLEAASVAPLISLAGSLHAWVYEAVLLIPALCYAMQALTEPWRTRCVVAAYLIASVWILAPVLRFEPLAIVVLSGWALWIARGYRQSLS